MPAGHTPSAYAAPRRASRSAPRRSTTHARRRLGVGFGESTADGAIGLDEVFCLGNCALGPAVRSRAAPRAGHAGPVRRAGRGRCGRMTGRGGPTIAPATRRWLMTVYVPRDSAARSVGADEVAAAARTRRRRRWCARARAGCCGWSRWSRWTTAAGRVGYGPVSPGGRRRAGRGRPAGRHALPASAWSRSCRGCAASSG